MTEHIDVITISILAVGGLVVLSMFVKSRLARTPVPALVGFLLIGLLLSGSQSRWNLMPQGTVDTIHLFAKLGLVALLFRIGLESNIRGLLSQLRRAALVWCSDVLVSGFFGFATMRWVLGMDLAPSLAVATAFTATSVGISMAMWEEKGATNTPNGRFLVDVAELDDISAVVLMGLLFAILPAITGAGDGGASIPVLMAKTTGIFLAKLVLFGGLCLVFSLYIEERITHFFESLEEPPDRMLVVVGIGLMIAAGADILGFSAAIGAFFAGLVFSRDPESVRFEASFEPVYELFTPFFFIGVGLNMDPAALAASLGLGAVLVVAAVLGKIAGAGVPTGFLVGRRAGVLVGVSMIPRAEITMVVMQKALSMGKTMIPHSVFGAMVMVSALTCMAGPTGVRRLLERWPQKEED